MESKNCSICKELKTLNNYDIRIKDINGTIKLRANCKDCRKIENQRVYQNRKAKKEEQRLKDIEFELQASN